MLCVPIHLSFLAILTETYCVKCFDSVTWQIRKMRVFFLIFFTIITVTTAENDESWTWNEDKQKMGRNADVRYAVNLFIYLLSDNIFNM